MNRTNAARLRIGLREVPSSSLIHVRLRGSNHLSSFGGVQAGNINGRNAMFTRIAIVTGLGVAAYGLYGIFSKFWIWPQEMRNDLREAIKARHGKDFRASARHYQRALDTARRYEDPTKQLGPAYHLKISGIAIALGSVLEEIPDLSSAYRVYETALGELPGSASEFQSSRQKVPDPNDDIEGKLWMRAVQISVRLAEIANLRADEKSEEKHLLGAADKVRRLFDAKFWPDDDVQVGKNDEKLYAGVELPPWADKVEVAGVFERLGEFYNRKGNALMAFLTYDLAGTVLLSSPDHYLGRRATITDRCRGAMMKNNMASILATPPDSSLSADKAWARKLAKQALDIVTHIRGHEANPECERTMVAILYNMGLMSEMASENAEAMGYFKRALEVAQVSRVEELAGTLAEAVHRRQTPPGRV